MADRLVRLAAYAWAFPNTLVGLMLGALSGRRPRGAGGVLVFDGPPRGTTWVLAKVFRRAGVTFGHVILADRALAGPLLLHELHHVGQYERLGPLYIPAYLVIWAFTGYARHPFERAARRAELGLPAP